MFVQFIIRVVWSQSWLSIYCFTGLYWGYRWYAYMTLTWLYRVPEAHSLAFQIRKHYTSKNKLVVVDFDLS
jgi:hypothetical protein